MRLKERVKAMDCNQRGHWIAFFICLAVSIFLMIGSAIVPPPFVVDASIFKCVAWLFGFAALAQVPAIIQSGKTVVLNHGNTSLTVGERDGDVVEGEEDEIINN